MLIKEALRIVGGLSKPSKMPSYGWSIPAYKCLTGSKLRLVEGSTCYFCYALKGTYQFSCVKNALEKRFDILQNVLKDKKERKKFLEAFKVLMSGKKFIRWHDAGDIQNVNHLNLIVTISRQNPKTLFWLPSREYKIVSDYIKKNDIPSNLIIRLSAHKVDFKGPEKLARKNNLTISAVHTKRTSYKVCESKFNTNGKRLKSGKLDTGFCSGTDIRNGKRVDCRACWNKKVFSVSYPIH